MLFISWITSSGNVGVGTKSPSEKLTVEGNISGSGTGSFGSLKVNGNEAITSTVTQGSFSGTVIDTPVQIVAVKDDASKGTTSFYFLCQGIYYWIAQVENS